MAGGSLLLHRHVVACRGSKGIERSSPHPPPALFLRHARVRLTHLLLLSFCTCSFHVTWGGIDNDEFVEETRRDFEVNSLGGSGGEEERRREEVEVL